MNASIAANHSRLLPSDLSSPDTCCEESVYAPGYIQPYGVLLTLEEPHLTISQVSENVEQHLGVSATTLVGQSLQKLFSQAQVKRVAEFLQHDNLSLCNPFELKARVKASSLHKECPQSSNQATAGKKRSGAATRTFRGTLHRTQGALILELEPHLSNQKANSMQSYHRLQTAILNLRSAHQLSELAQILANQVRAMTGFDRVMIYRFETDNHGVVIAEEKAAHLESYLGLHYPATDIPVPARQLFLRNWVRQIPDVNYTPAYFVSSDDSSAQKPLDLRDCVLRGVSPYHIEYLQNMGVAASLTISLVNDQNLWGLIACHHHSPKLVDYETRKTCEFLGQFASIELVHQQERELGLYQTQVKTIQSKLQQAFLREPNFIQQVLTRNANDLLNLVHAEGVAIALDQQLSLIGQTPPLKEVQDLLCWLLQLNQPEIYLTNCFARPYAPARAFTQVASGVLAISVVLHQKSYHLIWFRPEQIQTVDWAGNPHDAITVDEMGNLHLCPRKSFALWKETVQDTSLPWQSVEIEAARMMRNTLMLAVLEFSQAALEQAAERAAIANRAKSQFLAKMSHELRTPLNAILGFSQMMNRSPNTPLEFQEHLSIINRSGEHLLALINDVLEMSRIEAGQLVLVERPFNLHQLLRSLQDMFALKAAQKGLTLTFEIDVQTPHHVCSDEAKLRQILINLISNAIKFTTQGSVTVRVNTDASDAMRPVCTCYPVPTDPCHAFKLSLAIEDTGCGIDCHNWDSIFEAFMQTEQGRHAEGTGLGLSISRQFARLMGGDITVESSPGQGSTFTCQIILHQPSAMEFFEPEATHLIVGLEPGQPAYRILVAEDVLENRQLLKVLLEPLGFEVKTVVNGLEAIAQWKTWHPHLIVMDIQMPDMDGYEATRQIRAQESPEQKPTPIIALTAYAFADDRTASLKAGCNEHIAKPFTETVLLEAIAHYTGARYRYGEEAQPLLLRTQKTLSPQDLQQMPSDWLAQVHEAALDLRDERLRQLMADIPDPEQRLRELMMALIDNFQLEAIATLTQPWGKS
ncbi:response regulator [Oscillatoria sp. FACHB-1407]|uniref:response regulator n=1 Tax=Oscillatoria sp. FACHB-1407 TaxID=2692847 RepID=UPI001686F851|nr:response regulator [Oscillatoria sp. FACHB-1407]MBD2464817.1 response regulator [Oscillatoria sp. FACHB-1407]